MKKFIFIKHNMSNPNMLKTILVLAIVLPLIVVLGVLMGGILLVLSLPAIAIGLFKFRQLRTKTYISNQLEDEQSIPIEIKEYKVTEKIDSR